MTIANVLTVFLVILGLMLVFQAFWLFGTALFPRLIGQARDRYKTPIRTTLIGLAVVVPTFFIGFFWLQPIKNPIVKIIGYCDRCRAAAARRHRLGRPVPIDRPRPPRTGRPKPKLAACLAWRLGAQLLLSAAVRRLVCHFAVEHHQWLRRVRHIALRAWQRSRK